MHSAPRALIAGLGLIGGSIGTALRASGWRVAFVDPHVSLDDARRAGAADERVESLAFPADVTVIATPADIALELLRNVGRAFSPAGRATTPSHIITTVCSVMEPLRAEADKQKLNFVAGHPLAGSHERGLGAARGDLLRDSVWFVDGDDALIARMVRDCGARREIVGAAEHDACVALTSHLPQVLSTALAAYLDQESERRAASGERDLFEFAGSGLTTFLRLAASDASVWAPVIDSNRSNLSPHVEALWRLVRQIVEGDASAFERARAFMVKLER